MLMQPYVSVSPLGAIHTMDTLNELTSDRSELYVVKSTKSFHLHESIQIETQELSDDARSFIIQTEKCPNLDEFSKIQGYAYFLEHTWKKARSDGAIVEIRILFLVMWLWGIQV